MSFLSLTALLLAACASGPPAPVESRTAPATARKQPARPPAAVPVQPAPAPTIRAEPVRPSGVQVRPLAGGSGEGRSTGDAVKTEPQGLKKPYSESAAAELRGAGKAGAAAQEGKTQDSRAEASSQGAEQEGFLWPARGKLIQGFSEPRSMGISIAGNPGDPVRAAADGRVIFSGPGPRSYGNLVIVKHDADTLTVYAHNRALLVKDGAQVRRGQQIAELGESGTDRPKLHFEIRRGGKPVDPLKLLPPR